MNPHAIFQFESQEVRAVLQEGEPWFVAKDVAIALGYSNFKDAIHRHCKGGVKRDLPSSSGIQSYIIIPERDVYRLIMRSKLPSAERFEEWVVAEVLPAIRKNGTYTPPARDTEALQHQHQADSVTISTKEYVDLLKTRIRELEQRPALAPAADIPDPGGSSRKKAAVPSEDTTGISRRLHERYLKLHGAKPVKKWIFEQQLPITEETATRVFYRNHRSSPATIAVLARALSFSDVEIREMVMGCRGWEKAMFMMQ